MPENVKRQAIEILERLPDDASMEDVMEQLYLLTKVRTGLSQIEAGQVVAHEEAKKRLGH